VLLEGICRISITGLATPDTHKHSIHGSVHGNSHGTSKALVPFSGSADGGGSAAGGGEPQQPYDSVRIQQLELLPHTVHGSSSSSSSGSNGSIPGGLPDNSSSSSHPSFSMGSRPGPLLPLDSGLHNPLGLPAPPDGSHSSSSAVISGSNGSSNGEDVEQLGAALKASTKVLLQALSAASGLPAARRLLELLAAVPAWRAADVVAAALARTNQVRGGDG